MALGSGKVGTFLQMTKMPGRVRVGSESGQAGASLSWLQRPRCLPHKASLGI